MQEYRIYFCALFLLQVLLYSSLSWAREPTKIVLSIYNVDDVTEISVNGVPVTRVNFGGQLQLELNKYLNQQKNDIFIRVSNNTGGWTYGYKLERGGKTLVQGDCGAIGRQGCNNNSSNRGVVFERHIPLDLGSPFQLIFSRWARATPSTFGDCIMGNLYIEGESKPVANSLELPWRNNQNGISSIPPGEYQGFIREGTDRGWRIELVLPDRTAIQVHAGNWPSDSQGCILIGAAKVPPPKGSALVPNSGCYVQDSRTFMKYLSGKYGDEGDLLRPISIKIVDGYSGKKPS